MGLKFEYVTLTDEVFSQ